MNGECAYVLDGHDTDGTPWYRCTTHDELVMGWHDDEDGTDHDPEPFYCEGYRAEPYTHVATPAELASAAAIRARANR